MTPTDDIADPTWHDIFDRDREIKRLRDALQERDATIRELREQLQAAQCASSCEESGG
jgi:predicted RNase H-like nuclease (RuvC/YqgF family)